MMQSGIGIIPPLKFAEKFVINHPPLQVFRIFDDLTRIVRLLKCHYFGCGCVKSGVSDSSERFAVFKQDHRPFFAEQVGKALRIVGMNRNY